MRKIVALPNIFICMAFLFSVMLMSCNQEKRKQYQFILQGNTLFICIPHPSTINLEERDYWNYVNLNGIENDVFEILKKSSIKGFCELKVRFRMNPVADKYGNVSQHYQDAYITRIQMQEVSKYKESDYFSVAYSLNRNMRRAAFGIDCDFELIAEPPKRKHSILYYIWKE